MTSSNTRDASGRYTAAFVGSLLAFFLGWVPFAGPMAGGAVAGYLRGQDATESVIAGVLATAFASVLFVAFAAVGLVAQVVEGTPGTFIGWVLLCGVALAYFYACGAVGGYAGAAFSDREIGEN